MSAVYLILIHYPILNKQGRVITTSVTNFDLHDLARTAKTYGVKKVFIQTPLEVQQNMVQYIVNYWQEGAGAAYNPDRKEALEILTTVNNLKEAVLFIQKAEGKNPQIVATTARSSPESVSFLNLRQSIQSKPTLIMFGTGHGLAPQIFKEASLVLAPIAGPSAYNHLPVRSAVAIILDRLLG